MKTKRIRRPLLAIATLVATFHASTASADGWATTGTTGAPSARSQHTAVWTGSKMIIWGGAGSSGSLSTGGIYDPTTDTWTAPSTVGAPSGRSRQTAVWTGSKMIVWGGATDSALFDTGGIYDPATDSWTAMSTVGAPSPRYDHTAVWTGSKMIVWGGQGSIAVGTYFNTGGIYDPSTDTWTALSTVGAPSARQGHRSVWAGSKMIVWGGSVSGPSTFNPGGIYDPATDTWMAMSAADGISRSNHSAVWTGSRMVVWSGFGNAFNTGIVYDPTSDTWTAASTTSAPAARYSHVAVWTGSRMVVWGGTNGSVTLDTGGNYDPATNTWSTMSAAPLSARALHTAVWTGSKMIVWGGTDFRSSFNTGGVYDPSDGATTTVLSSSPNPSMVGDSVTFTATVTASSGTPTGTVTFMEGATTLGTGALSGGTATLAISSLSLGVYSIKAVYGGDGTFTPSTSSALTQTVRSATSTTLASSLNPSTTGQGVTFTATVTSSGGTPTGSVTFRDGSLPLGTYALTGGVATTPPITSLTVGSHLISASYPGNQSFLTSSSDLTQVVYGDNAGISIGSASIAEGNSGATNLAFIVTLSTPIAQTVTVQVATQDGTATAGSDYVTTSSTLTFNPGVTSQFFIVPITGDALDEPDETFFVNLSNPVNATLATTQAMGLILNDEPGTNPSTLDQVFTPVPPCRFVDGVNAADKVPAAANGTTARYYRVRGSTSSDFVSQGASSSAPNGCGVPDSATAIMVNLTVADPTNDGDIRVDASHFATPSQTSLLNYTFGGARFKNLANGVIVPLCNRSVSSCASGANPTSPIRDILVTFHAGAAAVSTYFLADVLGYFSPAPVTNLATIGCGTGTVFAELAGAQCPAGASRGTPECSQVAAGFPCAFGAAACTGATVYKNDGVTLSAFSTSLDNCAASTDWYIKLK